MNDYFLKYTKYFHIKHTKENCIYLSLTENFKTFITGKLYVNHGINLPKRYNGLGCIELKIPLTLAQRTISGVLKCKIYELLFISTQYVEFIYNNY